jgi:hypothetical protein
LTALPGLEALLADYMPFSPARHERCMTWKNSAPFSDLWDMFLLYHNKRI